MRFTQMIGRSQTVWKSCLAMKLALLWLFAIANLLIGGFAVGSLVLLAQGRLVPAAPPKPDPAR